MRAVAYCDEVMEMENLLVDLLPQLGLAAVILYLLMEEKKSRQKLEDKIMTWLDEKLSVMSESRDKQD